MRRTPRIIKSKRDINACIGCEEYQLSVVAVDVRAAPLNCDVNDSINSVFSWQTKDLDRVEVLGEELYTALRDTDRIVCLICCVLLICQKSQLLMEKMFCFNIVTLSVVMLMWLKLNLLRVVYTPVLQLDWKKCWRSTTRLDNVWQYMCNHWSVVDSHARNALGMVNGNGRSVAVYFSSLKELFNHICHLAQ